MSQPSCQSQDDSLYGSWVELEGLPAVLTTGLQSTASSFLQGELESMLQEAQLECERSSHTDSPPQDTSGTPRTASLDNCSKDCMTQEDKGQDSNESERRVNPEWLQNWASHPENQPPKDVVFQRLKQSASLSMRRSVMMKSGLFTSDLPLFLIPSLLTSHLLTLGLGIYIGKRLAASTSTL
ncbi:BCL2/adenovirus E1B 19 kDa protein-interacting protein 3-like [Megalops cyprinoides]|uniref:BCL2/adenovirus E1B 19 kDa protein-interacting protein 3-like n=1 Tax=Megalops cyprinoides TaxID=118141 RepID=UPI001863A346|nr:BCL2/adenovirus E1B 19 kDa protein-interacting protein 3-like [Megalops cyprinoides]